jgi:hypothetical protein
LKPRQPPPSSLVWITGIRIQREHLAGDHRVRRCAPRIGLLLSLFCLGCVETCIQPDPEWATLEPVEIQRVGPGCKQMDLWFSKADGELAIVIKKVEAGETVERTVPPKSMVTLRCVNDAINDEGAIVDVVKFVTVGGLMPGDKIHLESQLEKPDGDYDGDDKDIEHFEYDRQNHGCDLSDEIRDFEQNRFHDYSMGCHFRPGFLGEEGGGFWNACVEDLWDPRCSEMYFPLLVLYDADNRVVAYVFRESGCFEGRTITRDGHFVEFRWDNWEPIQFVHDLFEYTDVHDDVEVECGIWPKTIDLSQAAATNLKVNYLKAPPDDTSDTSTFTFRHPLRTVDKG